MEAVGGKSQSYEGLLVVQLGGEKLWLSIKVNVHLTLSRVCEYTYVRVRTSGSRPCGGQSRWVEVRRASRARPESNCYFLSEPEATVRRLCETTGLRRPPPSFRLYGFTPCPFSVSSPPSRPPPCIDINFWLLCFHISPFL